ncbi:MAG TPA: tetratricopeptide repeat protein, partial [Planctomycetes bacterium]|nr:tetratricopeptide repeat protein [Planctomycetota bacterium]
MKRHATSSAAAVLLAALLAVGCGGESAPDLPGDPPTEESASIPAPRDLSALDPALADRVRAALAELRADESDPARWMALGMTYEANEMGSLAIECYLRVVSDPAPTLPKLLQAKAWSRLAQTYGVLGDVEHAIEAMRHSIEAVPDYAPSHWRLGTYLFDWGDFDAARASFRRATELDPKHSGGWIGLARIHLQEDRPELAVQILTKLLAGKPKDSDALRLLRTAYIQAGRAEEA